VACAELLDHKKDIYMPMGQTAEVVAERHQVSRQSQDEFACLSILPWRAIRPVRHLPAVPYRCDAALRLDFGTRGVVPPAVCPRKGIEAKAPAMRPQPRIVRPQRGPGVPGARPQAPPRERQSRGGSHVGARRQ